VILLSHAHFDYAGGINALQHLSGVIVYTSPDGAKVLQSGLLQEDDPLFPDGPGNTRFDYHRLLGNVLHVLC